MSREIKFRVWDKKNKKMYSDNLAICFQHKDGGCTYPNQYIHGEFPMIYGFGWSLELQQFTGLHDVNGVEIYEGDIVKYKHADINRGIIMFNTDNFAGLPAFHVCNKDGESLDYYYGVAADDSYIVIGNVFEHPHLLDEVK